MKLLCIYSSIHYFFICPSELLGVTFTFRMPGKQRAHEVCWLHSYDCGAEVALSGAMPSRLLMP